MTTLTSQKLFSVMQTVLLTTCAVMFVAAVHPAARQGLRNAYLSDYRTLVSSARGDLAGTGEEFTVAKVKTRSGLFLEVYRNEADSKTTLVERIQMPDARDGYFSFNGNATNLALADIDHDGRSEILAPSFDHDLVGHLSIFRLGEAGDGLVKVVQ